MTALASPHVAGRAAESSVSLVSAVGVVFDELRVV
jgi:hypothetical protein